MIPVIPVSPVSPVSPVRLVHLWVDFRVIFGICQQTMILFYCLCSTDVCLSGGELFDLVADEEFHLTEGQVCTM